MAEEKKKIETEEYEDDPTSMPMEDFFSTTISDYDKFDTEAWNKGRGFSCPNFPIFDEKMEGLDSGLYMFAGSSNSGKSALLMSLLMDFCMNENNNLFGIYFSLDDTAQEIIPRLVAMHEQIPISAVSKPQRYQDLIDEGVECSSLYEGYLEKRTDGINWLKSLNESFKIVDANKIKCGEHIRSYIENLKIYLAATKQKKKLIVAIDSLSDIRFADKYFKSDKELNDYIAMEVKRWTVEFDIPIFGSLHLRKIDQNRRPTISDVKESGRYAYEASFLGVVHNDVSVNKQSATIYQSDPETGEKLPILELDWAKNKKSSFKGKTYHYFFPEYSTMIECDKESTDRFDALIYTN